uniref:Major sperm protein n=1 Tax=Caenorhabditis japonica TaxID=281687 RepID=A0A8R1EKZ8_CAEJA
MVESGACQSIGNAESCKLLKVRCIVSVSLTTLSPPTTMAQSVPPGDIATHPNAKIVLNVINSSARRIGYGIKTTNMKRLGVDPPRGVLDPKEAVSPSSGPTLRMEPPSSSVASGSSETRDIEIQTSCQNNE